MIPISNLLSMISDSGEEELDQILREGIIRYSQLLPDQDVVCFFLPKQDCEERQGMLQQAWTFLQKQTQKK